MYLHIIYMQIAKMGYYDRVVGINISIIKMSGAIIWVEE